MKYRFAVVLLIVLLLSLSACKFDVPSEIIMPYSNREYAQGDWELDELIAHFEELGFDEFEIRETPTFDESEAGVYWVGKEASLSESDSWFTEYIKFEKGEAINPIYKICIEYYSLIPTLTVENCPEFAELFAMGKGDPNRTDKLSAFTAEHAGEYMEFDATISDLYTDATGTDFFITFSAGVQDNLSFSKSGVFLSELGMTRDYYEEHNFVVGTSVHIIARIPSGEDTFLFHDMAIESMTVN